MSVTWDPDRYLAHADDRGRPFVELLARVPGEPRTVVDLGCGAGNLASVVRARWSGVDLLGVDSSAEMIEHARSVDTGGRYEVADVATWAPSSPVDAIVSNAMFQWVPDQLDVITRLLDHVTEGGSFAVQVPLNHDAPSHALLREVAAREPYAEHTADVTRLGMVTSGEYLAFFADRGWTADAWTTEYQHVLPGEDAVWSWISGTGARPYVQAMPDDLRDAFVRDYKAELRAAYPRRTWGTVLPFKRAFCVATRPSATR